MKLHIRLPLVLVGLLSTACLHAQQQGKLQYLDAVRQAELENVVCLDMPADGRFVYTAAYNAKAVCVFTRDVQSGTFSGVQTFSDTDRLDGVTALRLSPNGRYGATAAFRSNAVTLFRRDPQEGGLQILGSAMQRDDVRLKLQFAIELAWSPDSRFIYAIASASGAINVFEIDAQESLQLVEVNVGDARCLLGARGIAVSPDGSLVFVTSEAFGTLTMFSRDAKTGALTLKQVLQDEVGLRNLGGAFSVAVSPDGKFVYASSGRFRGDNSICVFKLGDDGNLALVQELVNGTAGLRGFIGGNEVMITRDGRNAYAVASRSNSLVTFQRDIATGKLTQMQALLHDTDGVGPLEIVSGLAESPDGKFIYAAAEGNGAVSIFRRQ